MALTHISLNGSDWKLLPMMPREWEWRRVWEHPDQVDPALWIPARVPGTVQDDAQDAGLMPDWTYDLNSRACEWTSERGWVYLKEFDTPAIPRDGTVHLHFEGVDYACHVYLNGEHLGDHEGMYDAFEFDVTDRLRPEGANRLVVVVEPAPREQGQIGRTSHVRIWKARFAYNWDWCVRLVPIGIWDEVSLRVSGPAHLRDVHVTPSLSEDLSRARVGVAAAVAVRGLEARVLRVHTAISFEGVPVGSAETTILASTADTGCAQCITVESPRLWWPNGYGEQALYDATVSLYTEDGELADQVTVPFGIRRVRGVANEGAPEGALPYVLEVNGVRVFTKGWNWAPIQQLYGREMTERYERWLRLVRNAHCNLLRVWGGGLLEKEVFYRLCDQFGIMVWQEFIQSSSGIDNRPSEAPEYLRYIREQAEKMIPRRRNHPSLVIWCGGNELMHDDWRPLDDSHPALAVLKECVQRLDPERLWRPTSASGPSAGADLAKVGQMHDVHGPWQYAGTEAHYALYNGIDALLHSEFGVEGAANLEAMRRSNTEARLWPPDATNPLWLHKGSWWIHREKLEGIFGPIGDLPTFVRLSQYLQAEGLRYAIEANRRRKWRCAGTIPWQLNESWPNLACTNVVDFYGQPRPAYWWCRRAYEPLHPSARYDRLSWRPGDTFQAEVWLNNSLSSLPACPVSWQVLDLRGNSLAGGEQSVEAPAGSAVRVIGVSWPVADLEVPAFILRLRAGEGRPVDYLFSTAEAPIFAPLREAPQTALRADRRGEMLTIGNVGSAVALCVRLEDAGQCWREFSENYFFLAPGEEVAVRCLPSERPVRVAAWNAGEVVV